MGEEQPKRAFCELCKEWIEWETLEDAADHMRLYHPDEVGEPERWPDGSLVVVDESLTPDDFRG